MANAASYRPLPIAKPIKAQAAKSDSGPCANPKATSPSANSGLVPISTGRPPQRSIALPVQGPTKAETTSDSEKAANTSGGASARSDAIGVASIAGR